MQVGEDVVVVEEKKMEGCVRGRRRKKGPKF
jgi:hypothetical protein